MSKKKLGKGLEAIFGGDIDDLFEEIQSGNVEGASVSGVIQIPIKDIKPNPHQPRKEFDKTALNELSESIKTHGIFNPITVVKSVNGYVLVMGERRLRASKLANLTEIPAYVVEYDDKQMMELSLLENTQREDLNIIEIADALNSLVEKYDYTQAELASRVGKSREYVANTLRLLNLPKVIQNYVIKGDLSNGHVRAILALEDEEDQILAAKKAISDKLSVRNVEKLVKEMKNPKPHKTNDKVVDHTYDALTNSIQNKLQTKVSINSKQLTVYYDGIDDLNRILEIIGLLDEEE